MVPDSFPPVVAERVQNMKDYFFAIANQKIKEVERGGLSVLNFGMGTPDLAPPPDVIQELANRVQDPGEYLYPGYHGLPALRTAIADWYQREYQIKLDEQHILPVAGSKEAIFFASLALLNHSDEVLIPDPGYPTYTGAAQLVGAKAKTYSLTAAQNYLPDIEALRHEDLSHVKMMWINYPHNPTGAVAQKADLEKILTFTREHGIVLVSDNPYSHVTFGTYEAPSILQVCREDDLVLELDSMSKTFNLAGLRLAWIAGNPELMTALKVVYSNIETGIFTAAQKAGIKALQTPAAWITQRNKVYEQRAEQAVLLSEKLGCTTTFPQASLYVWSKLPSGSKSSSDFCFELLSKTGIFVAPGSAFGSQGEGYIRIALCQDVAVFQTALTRLGSA